MSRERDPERDRERQLDQLAELPEHAHHIRRALGELHELVAALCEPARMQTIRLSAATPKKRDDVSRECASIAVLNPSTATVYVGVGGAAAEPGRESPAVPGGGALVLPIGAQDVELGADPVDLATGDAVVFLFRFATVQPFYFGAL